MLLPVPSTYPESSAAAPDCRAVDADDEDEDEDEDESEADTAAACSSKEAAAVALVNIDGQERSRRKTAGTVGAVISTILYGVLITAHVGPLTLGGAMYMPVAFSLGFLESGRKGL